MVGDFWRMEVLDTSIYRLITKLKALKDLLRLLNKSNFGCVHHQVVLAKEKLHQTQIALHANPIDPC